MIDNWPNLCPICKSKHSKNPPDNCVCPCHGKQKMEGMGNTVPTYENKTGGKQSDIPYRFDLLPPLSLAKVAQILKNGADKYGENNWHKIPVNENINHAIAHLVAYLANDNQEDHLRNALCRIFFASEVDLMNPVIKDNWSGSFPPEKIIETEDHSSESIPCRHCKHVKSAHIKDTLMNKLVCPIQPHKEIGVQSYWEVS